MAENLKMGSFRNLSQPGGGKTRCLFTGPQWPGGDVL